MRRSAPAKLAATSPDAFWLEVAGRLDWYRRPALGADTSFDAADFRIRWFADGLLNASVNCIDRHLPHRRDDTAILFIGDAPGTSRRITFARLAAEVNRMANVLKARGVGRGDRVVIYMPMVPEATYAMLACARIGAVHSVVFGGFSADALASRIADCGATAVITADAGRRGGRIVPLKDNVNLALAEPNNVRLVLTVKLTGQDVSFVPGRDLWWHEAREDVAPSCIPEIMNAEDPLFILYTSGSTGKPKGVLHTTGGYLTYAAYTHELVFGCTRNDIYWCTADVGWITGHSYVVYGPLANGVTTVMFEGVPNWPDASRPWAEIEKHGVTVFYTAPTAIRALMRDGDDWVTRHDRRSLRLLGTVGEPINPEAWRWYHDVVGEGRCPIVDTWWQTETGGILISPLPDEPMNRPGAATLPLPGIMPAIVDAAGNEIDGEGAGNLILKSSWPGQMRTVYGDPQRFFDTYFSTYPGSYFTGDGARRDADGHFYITGRVDDVLNVAGHRLGTAEIESALVAFPGIAEAAVVGRPHPLKGQGIHCFVILKADQPEHDQLSDQLKAQVRREIGAIATPDIVQIAPGLPKTRSGKIMRRILRKIAEGDTENLGDLSTLADPGIVGTLITGAAAASALHR